MTKNTATNPIRANRAGDVESCAGIVVQHIAEPGAASVGARLLREMHRLRIEAECTADATHAERCRQTADAISTLLDFWHALARVAN